MEASIHIFLYSAVHQVYYSRHVVSDLQLQKEESVYVKPEVGKFPEQMWVQKMREIFPSLSRIEAMLHF
jgi:hypothetical protein